MGKKSQQVHEKLLELYQDYLDDFDNGDFKDFTEWLADEIDEDIFLRAIEEVEKECEKNTIKV